MLHRTEGIVLKGTPYGEADLIVAFLTTDFGPISAFAKSPRKTKSRFGSSLEPLTHSKIAFWGKEDSKLPRLTQADIIEPYQELREDIAVFTSASEMAGLALSLLPEGEPNGKAFTLFKTLLDMLRGKLAPTEFLRILYKIRLLDITGYTPSFRCARCGKAGGKEGYGGHSPLSWFYTPEGSIICNSCISAVSIKPGDNVPLSPGGIKLYESLRTWDMEKVTRIKPTAVLFSEIERLLRAHMEYRHPEH